MYNLKLHFHFTGIGGSGMSGLAEILLRLGFKVSGSDLNLNAACRRLMELGAVIRQGHAAENLPESASLLVYSSAVSGENLEVLEARRRGIPVIRRAEVLAELVRLKYGIAVAGSHGKTTTTSLIAAVLEAAKIDPTVIIGGQVKAIGSGGKLGNGDFLVAESDESDRSFLLLKPSIAVVTNIDAEHLSAYGSLRELEESFRMFVEAVPFYGLAVFCIDDRRTAELAAHYARRKVTYGLTPEADIRAVNISYNRGMSSFDVIKTGNLLCRIDLPMPGIHLVLNSLAAIAVGLELNIEADVIKEALQSFTGVKRRLEIVGEPAGITVINDYGHHPTEVRATIAAVRNGWRGSNGRVHVIFQPHRYTRTRDCFADFLSAFDEADTLLMLPVYAAGEEALEGISAETLFKAVTHPRKKLLPDMESIPSELIPELHAGDVVVCLGAGSIGNVPETLVGKIEKGLGRADVD